MGQNRRNAWLIGVTVVALASALILTAYVLVGTSGSAGPNMLTFSIQKDPATGVYEVSPTNVTIAGNTLVRCTFINYDPTFHAPSAGYGMMTGTWMGREMVDWGNGTWSNVTSLPSDRVGHTFSVGGMMMGSGNALNVLLPPAIDANHPSIVVVEVQWHGPAHLAWSCGGTNMPMASYDPERMSGTVTVR
jgi:hypothetical protein